MYCFSSENTIHWLHVQKCSLSSHPRGCWGVLVTLQKQPSKLSSPEEHWRKMFSTHVYPLRSAPSGHVGSVFPVQWVDLGVKVLPAGQLGCWSTWHWQLSVSRAHPARQVGVSSFLQAHIPLGSVTAVKWLGHVAARSVEHSQLSRSIVYPEKHVGPTQHYRKICNQPINSNMCSAMPELCRYHWVERTSFLPSTFMSNWDYSFGDSSEGIPANRMCETKCRRFSDLSAGWYISCHGY